MPDRDYHQGESDIAGLDSISNDDVAGARLAVNYLHALGHRSIAHITGGDNQVALLRKSGYQTAMIDCGLAAHICCYEGLLPTKAAIVALKPRWNHPEGTVPYLSRMISQLSVR